MLYLIFVFRSRFYSSLVLIFVEQHYEILTDLVLKLPINFWIIYTTNLRHVCKLYKRDIQIRPYVLYKFIFHLLIGRFISFIKLVKVCPNFVLYLHETYSFIYIHAYNRTMQQNCILILTESYRLNYVFKTFMEAKNYLFYYDLQCVTVIHTCMHTQ